MSEDIGFLNIAELGARYRDGRLMQELASGDAPLLAMAEAVERALGAYRRPG